jgi:glycerol-3-phosphate acyltransferase PlsY
MPKTYICFALIMFFVSVYTHRSNIKNIVSGQEYKFKKKEGKND